MGSKGKKRREKNYRAAHGGQYPLLPPPPNPSQVDALPSKLRQIMSLTSNKPRDISDADRKRRRKDDVAAETAAIKDESDYDHLVTSETVNVSSETADADGKEKKKKKKRKTNQVEDLRFVTESVKTRTSEKKKERRKKYLESKKKKHKKSVTEDELEFPGREQIRFGDVVQAPPKLVTLPKISKKNVPEAASLERLRLQAIEAYRKRRGWGSRPGLQLPPGPASTPAK